MYTLNFFFLGILVNNSSFNACKPSIIRISLSFNWTVLLYSFFPSIKLNVGTVTLVPFNILLTWLSNNFTSIALRDSKSGLPFGPNGVSDLSKK